MIIDKIINWFFEKWKTYKQKRHFKKKLEELRKRDPFIYKH